MDILLTYNNYNYGGISFPSVIDIVLSVFWVFVVYVILFFYRSKQNNPIYKSYLPFFLFKMFSVFLFGFANSILYKGADSGAFWNMSNALSDLLFSYPQDFLHEMWNNPALNVYENNFYKRGITYPGWIYFDAEGYFISKITWFFGFFSGKQYLLTSLYFSFLGFLVQWRLYKLIHEKLIKNKNSKFYWLFLYIPSAAFWCSGISKDSIVLLTLFGISYYLIKWVTLKKRRFKYALGILFYALILYNVRGVVLAIVLVSFLLMWILTLVNSVEQRFLRGLLRIGVVSVGLVFMAFGLYIFGMYESVNNLLTEGQIIQQDFIQNQLYTGKKYSLGTTSFTPQGMILASPLAIFTGIFRPGIWEALTPTLILNGIESSVLLFVFIKRIAFKPIAFIRASLNNKFLLYALLLVLIYAFATGFTSIIFGVLVRLRAPLLMFFAVVLYWKDFIEERD